MRLYRAIHADVLARVDLVDHGPTIGPAAPMGDRRHGGLNTSESYV